MKEPVNFLLVKRSFRSWYSESLDGFAVFDCLKCLVLIEKYK